MKAERHQIQLMRSGRKEHRRPPIDEIGAIEKVTDCHLSQGVADAF
jgi:hypothetical protein